MFSMIVSLNIHFEDFINSSAKTGPINVFFMNKKKTFDVIGCVEAISAGTDTSGRKKSDVNLIDYKGKVYPISIKKDDADDDEKKKSVENLLNSILEGAQEEEDCDSCKI